MSDGGAIGAVPDEASVATRVGRDGALSGVRNGFAALVLIVVVALVAAVLRACA